MTKAAESNHAHRLRNRCDGAGGRYANCVLGDPFGSELSCSNEPIRTIYAHAKHGRSHGYSCQPDNWGSGFGDQPRKTFRAVFQRLDPADLDRRLGAYFTALVATEAAAEGRLLAVALDGKTLRGARRAGAAAAHLVSVFAPTAPG